MAETEQVLFLFGLRGKYFLRTVEIYVLSADWNQRFSKAKQTCRVYTARGQVLAFHSVILTHPIHQLRDLNLEMQDKDKCISSMISLVKVHTHKSMTCLTFIFSQWSTKIWVFFFFSFFAKYKTIQVYFLNQSSRCRPSGWIEAHTIKNQASQLCFDM